MAASNNPPTPTPAPNQPAPVQESTLKRWTKSAIKSTVTGIKRSVRSNLIRAGADKINSAKDLDPYYINHKNTAWKPGRSLKEYTPEQIQAAVDEQNEILKSKYDSSVIKVLITKGLVKEIKQEVYRLNNDNKIKKLNELNEYQIDALNKIKNSNKDIVLLNGVTGSGKTEIYMHLIDEVIKNGKEAIMLVPEISLTPQIINRFKN